MLWHLAARWGKVELGGIRLSLPLTHRLLGQLVGRRAPVGLPRARPPRRGRARHRPRRRVAPARHARRTTSRASPSAGTTSTPDRRGGARSGPRLMLQTEFTPGQRRSERQLVHVVWMTSGLGCDGDTVALTAATSPSLEELLTRRDPGHAGRRHLQPDARLRDRRRAHAGLVRRRARAPRPLRARARGLGAQRADQRRGPLGGVRRRPRERTADHHLLLDRPAGAEGGRRRGHRDVRGLRRRAGDAQQPDRRHGPARLPGLELDVAPGHPDRQPARLSGPAQQHHRDAARPRAATRWARRP